MKHEILSPKSKTTTGSWARPRNDTEGEAIADFVLSSALTFVDDFCEETHCTGNDLAVMQRFQVYLRELLDV